MSVESEILRIRNKVADSYLAVATKGGVIPVQQTLANLPGAINSISGGVSISVVGYTSFPASAPVNTIGVINIVQIGTVVISSTQPVSPTDGMVWIRTGANSKTPIVIDETTGASIYPMAAWQYSGDAWVQLDGRCYQDGWKKWDHIIYENGIVHNSFYLPSGSENHYIFDDVHITCNGTNHSICTNDYFDASEYSKACVTLEFYDTPSTTAGFRFGYYQTNKPARTDYPFEYIDSGHNYGVRTVSIDLPSSGFYAIGGLSRMSNSGGHIHYYIYKIWLEP